MRVSSTVLGRMVQGLVLWLGIGCVFTIVVSWALAAFLPQRRWTRTTFDGWKDDNESFTIESYQTTGACRRTWDHHIRAHDKYIIFFSKPIEKPIGNSFFRTPRPYPQTEYPLGWPHWGHAELARDWFLERLRTTAKPSRPGFSSEGCEHATGFPMVALWYEISPFANRPYEFRGGWGVQGATMKSGTGAEYALRALPFTPIYSGIAIDSAFWGTTAFVTMRFAHLARFTIRRRRGLCPTCAYDLHGAPTPGCPECGWKRGPQPAT